MYAVFAPWLGSLSDVLGRRKMIGIGLIGFAIANALTSFVSTFPLLLVSRGVAGLSAAAVTPSIYAITGDTAPMERRGGALAIVGSGLLMALWAGAPIGTMMSQLIGWQTVFRTLAGLGILLAFFNHRVWPGISPVPAGTRPTRNGGLQSLLADVSVMALWGSAVYGFYTYLGTGLQRDDHFSPSLVAIALIVYGIGATIGSLSGGRFADRWGASRIVTLSLLGLTILLGGAALAWKSVLWLFPLLFLWAFVGYTFFPAFQTWLARQYPQQRGMAMAWNNTALYVGITVGSIIGGAVVSKWSFGVLPWICALMALIGALMSVLRIYGRHRTVSVPFSE